MTPDELCETWAIILMGVSGCGKTTIGQKLVNVLGWDFLEGDHFHSSENIQKMAGGIPLNDEDRIPWLKTLHKQLFEYHKVDQPVILACSALKEEYRQILIGEFEGITLVHLKGDFELIQSRMRGRAHYMKPKMLQSQFDILEEPEKSLVVDIHNTPDQIIYKIINNLNRTSFP